MTLLCATGETHGLNTRLAASVVMTGVLAPQRQDHELGKSG